MKEWRGRAVLVGGAMGILAVWELSVKIFGIPLYVLPAPTDVAAAFGTEWETLVGHGAVTTLEALAGIGISFILALRWGFSWTGSRR